MTESRQSRRDRPGGSEGEAASPLAVLCYLTIQELAACSTLTVSTLRRRLKKGKLIGHKPGGARNRIGFRPDATEQAATAMVQATVGEHSPSHPQSASAPQHGPHPKWQQAK